MNAAHIHLASVHLPVIAIPLLGIILFAGWAGKNPTVSRTALIGILVVALLTIPVFLTGEPTEEVVEHMAGISEAQIEAHEDAATIAFVLVALSAAASLFALVAIRFRHAWASGSILAALFVTMSSSATLFWAANLGGKIRHSEISQGDSASAVFQESGRDEDDDD